MGSKRNLEADRVGPAVGIVNGEGDGLGDGPLVPHILPVVDAPEVKLNLMNGRSRHEDREPAAEHA